MSFSEILLYGGIAGMAGTVIAGIVVIFLSVKNNKRLQDQLNSEYGHTRETAG